MAAIHFGACPFSSVRLNPNYPFKIFRDFVPWPSKILDVWITKLIRLVLISSFSQIFLFFFLSFFFLHCLCCCVHTWILLKVLKSALKAEWWQICWTTWTWSTEDKNRRNSARILDAILKSSPQDSIITWDLIFMKKPRKTPRTTQVRFSQFFFFFTHFSCYLFLGRDPPCKSFSLVCWLYKQLFAAFLSRSYVSSSPLCTHSTFALRISDTQNPPWNILALLLICSAFNHNHPPHTAASLCPALALYLLCVNSAHMYKCVHGQPRSVFIWARMEAR